MTTKNLKIFHELNRLDTEEKKAAREKAIADKRAAQQARQDLEDSGHARAIIGGPVREPRRIEPEPIDTVEEEKKVIKEVKKQVNKKAKELGVETEPQDITCDICHESFSPQGFPMHYRSCLKKQEEKERLEKEKAELEKQVAELKAKKEAKEAEPEVPE